VRTVRPTQTLGHAREEAGATSVVASQRYRNAVRDVFSSSDQIATGSDIIPRLAANLQCVDPASNRRLVVTSSTVGRRFDAVMHGELTRCSATNRGSRRSMREQHDAAPAASILVPPRGDPSASIRWCGSLLYPAPYRTRS
jgi:hypothetical protein